MKSTLLFVFLLLSNFVFSQITTEKDPFTNTTIAFNDKNYMLCAKANYTIQTIRAERLQKDSSEVSYRIYTKVWLKSSFCMNEKGGIILLMEDSTQISLKENSLNCSKIKCGGGQCSHYIIISSIITPKEFFGCKNKSIRWIRINTTEGYVNLEIDSERYRTNLSRMIETFSEFEHQDLN